MSTTIIETKAKLLGSLLLFTQAFFKKRTGREFELSHPLSRESHYITICRSLTDVFLGNTQHLIITIPPRYAKTELMIHFIAWGLAHYPDANNVYISYSLSLAAKQTSIIRDIISLPLYRKLFGVEISDTSSAKHDFLTTVGGSVYAAGSDGSITGRGAGIKGVRDRYGGVFVMDDLHKPNEVTSDTMRTAVHDWYNNTALSRINEPSITPQVCIGQRTHEDDIQSFLLKDPKWKLLSLPALDIYNNSLNPSMHTPSMLLDIKERSPYIFASQYQQNPLPAGGSLFKTDDFVLLDNEPTMLVTFITVDTAETTKDYNDWTVFSFWGIYNFNDTGYQSDGIGLHWIDCLQIRVEPKDLESEFKDFYNSCMLYAKKPRFAAIEKKSTGVTLASVLNSVRGIEIIGLNKSDRLIEGVPYRSKTDRFLASQPAIAKKYLSLPRNGKHTQMCIDHMSKITANNSHRFDDIADTCADAIRFVYIDKTIFNYIEDKNKNNVVKSILESHRRIEQLRKEANVSIYR